MKKIKIIHILISKGFAGSEKYLCDLVDYQSKFFDVSIIILKKNIFLKKNINKNVKTFQIIDFFKKIQITEIINKNKPDIIHTHLSNAAKCVSKSNKFKIIATAHMNFKNAILKNCDALIVSNSTQFKEVAKNFGSKIIDRPSELATDLSGEWSAWRHAIESLEKEGKKFDYFLSLPATAPLRSEQDVVNCFELMSSGVDIVITASTANRNPYFNMIYRESDGTSRLVLDDNSFNRRQEAPQVYDVTTVAYLTTPSYIKSSSGIFEGKVKSVIIPKERAIDIDDEVDFLLTKAIYEN